MEVPYWVNYLIWALVILVGFIFLFLFNSWSLNRKVTDKKTGRQKIIGEIWGADGYPTRTLIPIEPTGKTVKINGLVYRLNEKRKKDTEEEEEEDKGKVATPALRYEKYPKAPFMGIGPQKVLRIESWQEGNPEPIKPFYGSFVDGNGDSCNPDTEGAIFVQNKLMLTATEIVAMINEEHAAAASAEIEELAAQRKTFQDMLKNMPSKTILYLLVGGNVILTLVAVVLIYSAAGA